MTTFAVGDRVRIKPELLGGFTFPTLNTIVRQQRIGVVDAVYGIAIPAKRREYSVHFPAKGRSPAYRYGGFSFQDLELAP